MQEHHESKIREILINTIVEAKSSIHVALSYFNDIEIVKLIKRRADEGLSVEVVIYDHPVNSPAIIELNSENIRTHFYDAHNSSPIYPKFCLIDENILITGNHGWTYAANRVEHPEPAIMNNESGLIDEYFRKFKSLKRFCGSSKFVHFRLKPEKSLRS